MQKRSTLLLECCAVIVPDIGLTTAILPSDVTCLDSAPFCNQNHLSMMRVHAQAEPPPAAVLAVGFADNAVELFTFEVHTSDAARGRSRAALVPTLRVRSQCSYS